ncbi:MAG: GNA1162 family protein [Candidatus Firestonebacteria bacterium]
MKKIILLILIISILSGCGLYSVATKKDYDFSKIKRVAVVGFSSNRTYKNSGEVVSDEFVLHLMKEGYSVIERSKIDAILREQNLGESNRLESSTVKKIGKILGVDAVITGTVIKYHEDENTSVYTTDKDGKVTSQIILQQAEVEVSARMFDVETGEIIWTAKDSDRGFDISDAVTYVVASLIRSIK